MDDSDDRDLGTVCVVDVGSREWKLGYAGEDAITAIVPSSVGWRAAFEEEEEGAGLDPSYDEALEIAGEPELSSADMENPGDISNVPDDMIDDADDIFDAIEGEET